MDRRIQRTIKAIRDAFGALLERKTYASITVQDILDEANVGRSTFYEHYKTKDELLHAVCAEIFSHVFSERLVPEAHHDFSHTNDLHHVVMHMFYHFSEDKREIRGILSSEGKPIFIADLKKQLSALVDSYILTEYHSDRFEKDLLANHLIASLAELTLWWMARDCDKSPEEMAETYFALVLPSLK